MACHHGKTMTSRDVKAVTIEAFGILCVVYRFLYNIHVPALLGHKSLEIKFLEFGSLCLKG